MALGEVLTLTDLIAEIGKIALWLQALGIIIVGYTIFQIISLYFEYKRFKQVKEIRKDMARIENKINSLRKRK